MTGPITPVSSAAVSGSISPAGGSRSGAFQEALEAAIGSVEAAGRAANASVERFLSGEGEELHQTVLATERAELSFELFLQVRNKLVSAYQEIMRLQM